MPLRPREDPGLLWLFVSFLTLSAPGPKPLSAPFQLAPVAENCVRLRPRPAGLGATGPSMTPRVRAPLPPPLPRADFRGRTHAVPWEVNQIEASPWCNVGGGGQYCNI
ncbi:hypothetical protein F5883DRAFT_90485 [Diaporthe sp. PMI_573]|nr:hypothetical protein F5883DRAFT_90485 [Diaporthaceae sp. PMI_573]